MWHERCEHSIRPVNSCRSPGWLCICALFIILYPVDAAQLAGSNEAALKSSRLSPPPEFVHRLASILQNSVASRQEGNEGHEGRLIDESSWAPPPDIPKSIAVEHPPPMTNTHDRNRSRNPLKLLLSTLFRVSHHPKNHRHGSEGKTSQSHSNSHFSVHTIPHSYSTLPSGATRLGNQHISDGTQQQPSTEPMQLLTSSNFVWNGQVGVVQPETHEDSIITNEAQSSSSPQRSTFRLAGRKTASNARRAASMRERDAVRFRPGLRQMPRVIVSDPSAGQSQSQGSASSPTVFRKNSQSTNPTALVEPSPDCLVSKGYGTSAIVGTPPDSRQLIPANIGGSPSHPIPLVPKYSASPPLSEQAVSNPDVSGVEESAAGSNGRYHSVSSPSSMRCSRQAARILKQPANSVEALVGSSVVTMLIPTALGGDMSLFSDSAAEQPKMPSHVNSGGLASPGIPPLTSECSSTTFEHGCMPLTHGGSPSSSSGVRGQCTENDVPRKTNPYVKTQSSTSGLPGCGQPPDAPRTPLVPSATPDKSWLDNALGVDERAQSQTDSSAAPQGLLPAKLRRYRVVDVTKTPIPVGEAPENEYVKMKAPENVYVQMAPVRKAPEDVYVQMANLKKAPENVYVQMAPVRKTPENVYANLGKAPENEYASLQKAPENEYASLQKAPENEYASLQKAPEDEYAPFRVLRSTTF